MTMEKPAIAHSLPNKARRIRQASRSNPLPSAALHSLLFITTRLSPEVAFDLNHNPIPLKTDNLLYGAQLMRPEKWSEK